MNDEKDQMEEVNNSSLIYSEEKRKDVIHKEDRKKLGFFILIIILSSIFGGVMGALLVDISKGGSLVTEITKWMLQFQRSITEVMKGIMLIVDFVGLLFIFIDYQSIRRMWNNKEKREENWDRIDIRLGRNIFACSLLSILNLVLYGLGAYLLIDSKFNILLFLIVMLVFFITVFSTFWIQKKSVNLLKEMNPEKKGSLYDFKFQKRWFESCDEAEQTIIGRASYISYRVTSNTCIVLIVILAVLSMAFEIGMIPLILVGFIMIVSNVAYYIGEKKGMKRNNKE